MKNLVVSFPQMFVQHVDDLAARTRASLSKSENSLDLFEREAQSLCLAN